MSELGRLKVELEERKDERDRLIREQERVERMAKNGGLALLFGLIFLLAGFATSILWLMALGGFLGFIGFMSYITNRGKTSLSGKRIEELDASIREARIKIAELE